MDDRLLSRFAQPVADPLEPQPRLHRLLDKLHVLKPAWAFRVEMKEGGLFAIEIFVYRRPVENGVSPYYDLLEIRRVDFPAYEDGEVFQWPERLVSHWIDTALASRRSC